MSVVSNGRFEHRLFALALCATLAGVLFAPPARAAQAPTTRTKLENGLSVIVVPTSRLPLVDFRLVARAGSVNDFAGK